MFNLSNGEILLIVSGTTLIVGGLIYFLFPYVKSKGIDVPEIISKAKEVAADLDNAADVVKDVVPNPYAKALDYIAKYSLIEKGVGEIDQMYNSGQITDPSKRKEEAVNSVINDVSLLGININDKLKKYIEGAIEFIIDGSKSDMEKKTQLQNAQQKQIADLQAQSKQQAAGYQATIQDLTSSNTALQQHVADLTAKLNNIQAVVTPATTQIISQ